jgi:hypothetical protein
MDIALKRVLVFETQEKILFEPFNQDLPQWDVHVLNGYHFSDDSKQGTALIFRLNHWSVAHPLGPHK